MFRLLTLPMLYIERLKAEPTWFNAGFTSQIPAIFSLSSESASLHHGWRYLHTEPTCLSREFINPFHVS
jgi:hypothetical protein